MLHEVTVVFMVTRSS